MVYKLARLLTRNFHFLQLGPNVSIGPNTTVEPGVRIRESIVLANAHIQAHSLILHSIIGTGTSVGEWARVEGTPCDPNPNKPFAKMDNLPLFNINGKLNPSITILGKEVTYQTNKTYQNCFNVTCTLYVYLCTFYFRYQREFGCRKNSTELNCSTA